MNSPVESIAFARIAGAPLLALPQDLYIPPDALSIFLETFEGPLDLLLYLIKRQNLNILDISITDITAQYLAYMELMTALRWELAADYLVMAATLAELKSRLLLPRASSADEPTADDLRASLIARLQDYARFKQAAIELDARPRLERDLFTVHAALPLGAIQRKQPEVDLHDLVIALRDVWTRVDHLTQHRITRESLSLRERMAEVLNHLSDGMTHHFNALFDPREGRAGVVVTFLALLELLKSNLLELLQSQPFAPIQVQLRTASPSIQITVDDHASA
ncbi:segregation/condensation protein A [Chromatium weissei]|nr:segregation/condensation protein A [Chromatium weissei]